MVRNWYVVLLFATKLFGPVRGTKFGTKLFGSVRGSKTWYNVIWFGSRSVIFSYQFGTNYLFGSVRIFVRTTLLRTEPLSFVKKIRTKISYENHEPNQITSYHEPNQMISYQNLVPPYQFVPVQLFGSVTYVLNQTLIQYDPATGKSGQFQAKYLILFLIIVEFHFLRPC